jgi:hypothetical protein
MRKKLLFEYASLEVVDKMVDFDELEGIVSLK